MSDLDQNRKRLTIRRGDGVTVYCASAWPGLGEVVTTLIASAIIAGLLAGLLLLFNKVTHSFDVIAEHNTWLSRILRFIFMGALDLSFVLVLALLLLWLPYWLAYQL
ncbi:MAG: hypothetical protein ACYTDV_12400, partial [Planctomycetota bacterium]